MQTKDYTMHVHGSTTEGVVYMIVYSRAQCRILLVYLTIIIYKCEYSNLCG